MESVRALKIPNHASSTSRMGLSLSSLLGSLSSLINWSKDKDVRILMLGLDSAGKVSRITLHGLTLYQA
jgi:hypothetical protein